MIKKPYRKEHTMGIRVDLKTLSLLEKVAQKKDRTVSNLVRIWINENLAKELRKISND